MSLSINREYLRKKLNSETEINRSESVRAEEGTMNIMHVNIRNARKNLDELKIFISEIKIETDIIVLSETWCTSNEAQNMALGIKGYEIIWNDTKYNQNGGIGIAIKNGITYSSKSEKIGKFEAEAMWLEIKGERKENDYILLATYRSPARKVDEFLKDMDVLLQKCAGTKNRMIIIGDMNINYNNDDAQFRRFKDIMEKYSFVQVINEDTRITTTSSTKIDLCFVNIFDREMTASVIQAAITDHNIIHIKKRQIG